MHDSCSMLLLCFESDDRPEEAVTDYTMLLTKPVALVVDIDHYGVERGVDRWKQKGEWTPHAYEAVGWRQHEWSIGRR